MDRATTYIPISMASLVISLLLVGPGCAAIGSGKAVSYGKNVLALRESASATRADRSAAGKRRSGSRSRVKLRHRLAKNLELGFAGFREKSLWGVRLPRSLNLGRTYLSATGALPGLRLELGAGAALVGIRPGGASLDAHTVYSKGCFSGALRFSMFWLAPHHMAYAFTATAVFVI